MEPASERDIRSEHNFYIEYNKKTKRGYALDITTLSVFHHLLSCYLFSLAKIRLLFRIPNKKYRRNDIKKRQSFAHIAPHGETTRVYMPLCIVTYRPFFVNQGCLE